MEMVENDNAEWRSNNEYDEYGQFCFYRTDSMANETYYSIDGNTLLLPRFCTIKLIENDIISIPMNNLSEGNNIETLRRGRRLSPNQMTYNIISNLILETSNLANQQLAIRIHRLIL